MKVLVLNGPNLDMLGTREPSIYGKQTYRDLVIELKKEAKKEKIKLKIIQSNFEGVLIEFLHRANNKYDYIILNAAGLTHTSVCLYDAIKAIQVPVIEVHLSNIDQREDFRKINYVRPVCLASFYGKGFESYKDALKYLIKRGVSHDSHR